MADVDGAVFELTDLWVEDPDLNRPGIEFKLGEYFPDVPRLLFNMRGWNTTLGAWETWTSADEPDPTPPIGPCVGVTASAVFGWYG